jgi:hypothetical protein
MLASLLEARQAGKLLPSPLQLMEKEREVGSAVYNKQDMEVRAMMMHHDA